jgi:putative phage-type endonuclease
MSDLQIFNCEQGTPEWFACRAGIPTASEFDTIMANGRSGGPSATRRKYMLKLIGEKLTGEVQDGFSNSHTDRGHAMEPDARNLYAMIKGVEPVPVGFMRRGLAGASPDSLVGDSGLLEIKTKLPHLHLEVLLSDEMPSEHRAQVQGQLWISGREYCDFVSYWPGLFPFIKRVYRDESFIENIAVAVYKFIDEMEELTQRFSNLRHAA